METIEILAAAVFAAAIIMVFYYRSRARSLEAQLKDVSFQKQSLSVKYGKMTEQFLPFLETYPYDRQGFRFLGTPIDGVQFEKDKIIFIEFKAGSSQLSERQREIKHMVNGGRVEFRELKIS